MAITRVVVPILLAAFTLLSCAGDDLDYRGPLAVSAVVVAAEGGTLTLPDGARVTIPPGALSHDATVTFSRLTCGGVFRAQEFGSCAYSVTAADGVALTGSYDLKLPTRSPGLTPDCLLSSVGDGQQCLAMAQAVPGSMTASASRFTSFVLHTRTPRTPAINLISGLDFTHCGGDLFGTWELVLFAGPLSTLTGITSPEWNPRFDVCGPDGHYDGRFTRLQETLEITPTTENRVEDADYYSSYYLESLRLTITTDACLDLVDMICSPLCEHREGLCVCPMPYTAGGTGTNWLYAVEGGYSFFEGGEPLQYCVLGDTLIRRELQDGVDNFWVYRRK